MSAHRGPISPLADEWVPEEAHKLAAALEAGDADEVVHIVNAFCHEGIGFDERDGGQIYVCSHSEPYGDGEDGYTEALFALGRVIHRRLLDGWGGC